MKGRKGSVDEGGLRVPFLIRWPGHIRPGLRIPQIAGAIDLLPTLAGMAGIPVASKKSLDGKSLKPLLISQAQDWPDRMIFSLQGNKISVRTQQYRLDAEGRLFDIGADPGQDRDIAREKPEMTAKLLRAQTEWAKEMLPLVGADDRPFPVGNSTTTLLPARDGVPEGGIKRSASAPNCSYFTNWTRREDRMTWDIEVAKAGEYIVDLYYTCRRGDEGSTLELSFQESKLQGKITEPHDPPLVGAELDRVRREESYWKDFRPMSLGRISLRKNRGKLTLRALDIAGQQVADVRRISLRLS
jgi:hypothetical protein